MRTLFSALTVVLLLLVAGCREEEKIFAPDPEFSINVWKAPEWWPREDKDWPVDPVEARIQQDALAEYGRPQFFRAIWRTDRRVVTQAEMRELIEKKSSVLEGGETEWIYLEDRKVLRFHPRRLEERPLDDRLRVLCLNGDPEQIRLTKAPDGRTLETYTYYSTGMMYRFDKETGLLEPGGEESLLQTMPGYRGRQ